jgi:hypothetical protein
MSIHCDGDREGMMLIKCRDETKTMRVINEMDPAPTSAVAGMRGRFADHQRTEVHHATRYPWD